MVSTDQETTAFEDSFSPAVPKRSGTPWLSRPPGKALGSIRRQKDKGEMAFLRGVMKIKI